MKKDNKSKLKQFVKKHELAFAIAGGAVILVAGVAIGYACTRKPTNLASIHSKSTGKEDISAMLEVAAYVDKGTRATLIWEPLPGKVCTVAEHFGEDVDMFLVNDVQPDDVISNIIFNIAKKAET